MKWYYIYNSKNNGSFINRCLLFAEQGRRFLTPTGGGTKWCLLSTTWEPGDNFTKLVVKRVYE